jgi:hypothetical protein
MATIPYFTTLRDTFDAVTAQGRLTKELLNRATADLSGVIKATPTTDFLNSLIVKSDADAKSIASEIATENIILARKVVADKAVVAAALPANTNPGSIGTTNLDNSAVTASSALQGVQINALPRTVDPANRAPAVVRVNSDMRVRIVVPPSYLTVYTSGFNNELSAEGIGGIIFPYTPTISYSHKAEYAPSNPTHSNFTIYSYQRSSLSEFTIAGKFTVQNKKDAGVYLATLRLLSALTKMRSNSDSLAGAPPPVCRLRAYGDQMMDNVPIAITGVKIDYPDNIDYYNIDAGTSGSLSYQTASVPTISTITVSCIPMYSRREMQQFSVTGWLNDKPNSGRSAGFL